ncbi:hypothetical protein OROGR_018500 [Orobanche gracilis]
MFTGGRCLPGGIYGRYQSVRGIVDRILYRISVPNPYFRVHLDFAPVFTVLGLAKENPELVILVRLLSWRFLRGKKL